MSMLAGLHLYPKTPKDLTVTTRLGGTVSLIGLVVMGFLFATELRAYMVPSLETSIELDDNAEKKLLISFNISLPHVPCHVASVDVKDVLGTRIANVTQNVFKYQLDAHGRVGAMVGGAVSFASEGQRLSRTSRDSLRAVAVEDQTAASEEAHRTGIAKGGSAADDGLARDDLDPEDFDSALASYDLVLVNFYAPWCPHCIQFDPIWRDAGRRIEALEYGDDVLLAKLNCNDNRKFCEEAMAVDRFPTIRAFANGGSDMENYEHNLDADAILAYVGHAMQARIVTSDTLNEPGGGLQFHEDESVQVLWHNGWRDARVYRVLGEVEGVREYGVKFERLQGGEGEESVQFLQIMGALIRVVDNGGGELDHSEHAVSAHVMRLKPKHHGTYKEGEPVQLRMATEWVPGEVLHVRSPADSTPNCTQWAASGECNRNPKHMLKDCRVACNVSHGLEYEVKHQMHRSWVSAERMLPPQSALHVGSHNAHLAQDGCLVSGQVMVKRVPGLLLLRVDGKKQSFNVKATNLTHRIHHLSFGHSDDRMNSAARRLLPSLQGRGLPAHVTRGGAPLDGDEFASAGKHESHEHFLKVVRTTFRPLSQDIVDMYHFTTSAATHTTQQGGVPAVTFTYDLSPMQVIIAEESEGLFRFVVYVFAIIGGGFTVFGMIDGLVYHSDRLLREKVGLGKAA